jgi:hypothetical protein
MRNAKRTLSGGSRGSDGGGFQHQNSGGFSDKSNGGMNGAGGGANSRKHVNSKVGTTIVDF